MGQYCRICGRVRPNEKFSGSGHGKHICRECANGLRAEARKERKAWEERHGHLSDDAKAALAPMEVHEGASGKRLRMALKHLLETAPPWSRGDIERALKRFS